MLSWLLLCLSSLGGQGMSSTFYSVCVCRWALFSVRFLSSKFLHPVCSIQPRRDLSEDLNLPRRFSTGSTHEVFQSQRAQGHWLGWT